MGGNSCSPSPIFYTPRLMMGVAEFVDLTDLVEFLDETRFRRLLGWSGLTICEGTPYALHIWRFFCSFEFGGCRGWSDESWVVIWLECCVAVPKPIRADIELTLARELSAHN